jgi:hypothetical protein
MGQAVSIISTCLLETNADANSVSSQHLLPVHVRSECLFRVNLVVLTVGRLLPAPHKQTFSGSGGMFQRCHEWTHAPQQ